MPPPRSKPGDTTERPELGRAATYEEDTGLEKTRERKVQVDIGIDDTSPSNQASRRDVLIDTTISGYKVEGVLGRGAAGIVYRAKHQGNGKKAAFKVLKPEFADEPEYIRRLIEEARALTAIRHKGIIDILDFGALPNGQPYLVMELCEGLSLEEQLKFGGVPPIHETLGLMDELLDALEAAHARGVIHRDLKPSNLFLATYADGSRVLKVLDFGLARRDEGKGSIRPTSPGVMIGTPDYMPPEQIAGRKMGGYSDVYAVGGIAFRLLTGRLPFVAATAIAVLGKKMEQKPPRPREVDPKVAPELDALVFQMLAPEPENRPTVAQARAGFAKFRNSLRRGPVPSLMDEDDDESSLPTAFHQFDEPAPATEKVSTRSRLPDTDKSALQAADPVRGTDPAHELLEKTQGERRSLVIALVGLALLGAGLWFALH